MIIDILENIQHDIIFGVFWTSGIEKSDTLAVTNQGGTDTANN